jgi:hypothetical protein
LHDLKVGDRSGATGPVQVGLVLSGSPSGSTKPSASDPGCLVLALQLPVRD